MRLAGRDVALAEAHGRHALCPQGGVFAGAEMPSRRNHCALRHVDETKDGAAIIGRLRQDVSVFIRLDYRRLMGCRVTAHIDFKTRVNLVFSRRHAKGVCQRVV
jgi:hypothetical protein